MKAYGHLLECFARHQCAEEVLQVTRTVRHVNDRVGKGRRYRRRLGEGEHVLENRGMVHKRPVVDLERNFASRQIDSTVFVPKLVVPNQSLRLVQRLSVLRRVLLLLLRLQSCPFSGDSSGHGEAKARKRDAAGKTRRARMDSGRQSIVGRKRDSREDASHRCNHYVSATLTVKSGDQK